MIALSKALTNIYEATQTKMANQRRAVIDDLVGIEEKIDRKQEAAMEERSRAAGGGLTGSVVLGLVKPPGTVGRGGMRWSIGKKYVVRVTTEQGGHLFNISHRSDRWPPGTIGPWDDHTRLMNLANLLKSDHVRVGHYDHDNVRHYRFVF